MSIFYRLSAVSFCGVLCVSLIGCGSGSGGGPGAVATPTAIRTPIGTGVNVDNLEARTYQTVSGKKIPYRLFVPAQYDPRKSYPVILFLHGAGGRGTDNRRQLSLTNPLVFVQPAAQARQACFFIAPQCPPGEQWVNTDWRRGSYSQSRVGISDSLQGAYEILQAVQREFSIDPKRLYVTGLSMGGYGTWDLILRYPTTFAAAIAVCGAGDPEQAGSLRGMGLWAFHAANDDIVPVSGSREMVSALKATGQTPSYSEYQQGGHPSWIRAYATSGLADWLFSFRH